MDWISCNNYSKNKIGKQCIIGAHSFVNRDIPENSTAYGVPAVSKKMKNKKIHRWNTQHFEKYTFALDRTDLNKLYPSEAWSFTEQLVHPKMY